MTKYLYNGVELPDISTVWTDKASYPYACIALNNNEYQFKYSASAITVNGKGSKVFTQPFYYEKDGEWAKSSLLSGGGNVVWSNHDIYYTNSDSEIYLPASDPVPVGGEPEEPEQSETDLTNIDLYRKINGKPTKLTLYKKLGGKLVPLDEHTKEVKT